MVEDGRRSLDLILTMNEVLGTQTAKIQESASTFPRICSAWGGHMEEKEDTTHEQAGKMCQIA